MGLRTLMVSADLRRPTLDTPFVAKVGPGLCDALTGWVSDADTVSAPSGDWASPAVPLEQLLRFTGVPNLWLLPSGGVPPNPAELLSSERAGKLFARLRLMADMVIIDAPPLVVVDPVLLGGLADGMVVVASVGDTERDAARHARETLESSGERVLGVILNRVTPSTGSYGYAYGYEPHAPAEPSRQESRAPKRRAR
jgi:Mrp family chromosome partitioning ATPase